MKKSFLAGGLLIASLILSHAAFAESGDFQKEMILSPMIGLHGFHEDQNLDTGGSLGLGLGYRFAPQWMGEIMVHGVNTEEEKTHIAAKAMHASLNGLYLLRPDKAFRPYGAAGFGVLAWDVDGKDKDKDFALNAGAGFFADIVQDLAFRLDGRFILPPDGMEWNLAAHAGLAWTFGRTQAVEPVKLTPPVVRDSDGDGLPDTQDRCPDTPAGVAVDATGCSLDSDGDGVPDYLDHCPGTPAGETVDAKGCPLDSDGDGVSDTLDACSGTPAGVPVDAKGCPLDSDGDGVSDTLDACPGTPAGVVVNAKGCPLAGDRDGDGIVDTRDACPDTPPGVTTDAKGCPVDTDGDGIPDYLDRCEGTPKGATVTRQGCWKIQGLAFASSSNVIQPGQYGILDNVLHVLKQNPELSVEIGGHTDSRGSLALNRKLSAARAQAVADYFISKGIAPDRLQVKGYGPDQPVASNDTREGQAENRRVELIPLP